MKIKKVKIENFRNIKMLEFDVSDATIISGDNKLGKSNSLNALVWFFTDTIYTDNSGVGENDINSIVPKNQQKGEHTSVSVEFESCVVFTKVYKTGYDKITGKANKHTTEGYINGVASKNTSVWKDELYKVINFNPVFPSFKELNIFIDPLYALQKLEPKELRKLLVSCGCTATNEELFKLGFEDLKQYEGKYLGDFVNMRLDIKQQIKLIKENINKYQILLEPLNSVDEFNDKELQDALNLSDELQVKKSKLLSTDSNERVKTLEYELKDLLIQLESEKNKKSSDIEYKIKELKSKKELEIEKLTNEKNNKINLIDIELENIKHKITNYENAITSYSKTLEVIKNNLETTQNAGRTSVTKKSDYQAMLISATQKVFTDYVVCPHCGTSFAPDPDAEAKFNNDKQRDIDFYTREIETFNTNIKNYHEECKKFVSDYQKIEEEKNSIYSLMCAEQINYKNVETKKNNIINTPIVTSSDIDNEIVALTEQLNNIPDVNNNPDVIKLKNEIDSAKNNNDIYNIEKVNDIKQQIDQLEETIENLYVKRSDWNQKIKYQKDLEETIKKLSDTEYLIGRVDDFIHTMIKVINNKAKTKTGIDFVMLEENLGNDGVKEVCYAVVDGVPFAMINTADKYIYGIKFIEKIKDIVVNDFEKPRNDLPVLADKLEGIAKLETIKNITSEQLIATRVDERYSTITIL